MRDRLAVPRLASRALRPGARWLLPVLVFSVVGLLAALPRLILVQSALLALVALLVVRLFGPRAAALAGPLLALDPWLVAHGRVLHLDALLATLLAIAVLACLIRWRAQGGPLYLLLGGLAAGLAILTKSAALVLLPPLLLVCLARAPWRGHPRRFAVELGALAALAVACALLAWPALLHNP